jgi:hypothetical protein
MPDGLYERDILAWSEQQADLIRRLGPGLRANDLDWANIAEEIESVGRSELHSVESFLVQIIAHVLKIRAWPDNPACGHWMAEILTFQSDAHSRFSPSMRQRINLQVRYASGVKIFRASDSRRPGQRNLPDDNPFALDDLLNAPVETLLLRLRGAVAAETDEAAAP